MASLTIQLECVGNVSAGYIHAQCRVVRFETAVDPQAKRVTVTAHHIGVRDFDTEAKVNVARFDVPEGFICWYTRRIDVKTDAYESKWFIIRGGKLEVLGDGATGPGEFAQRHLGDDLALGYSCEMRG